MTTNREILLYIRLCLLAALLFLFPSCQSILGIKPPVLPVVTKVEPVLEPGTWIDPDIFPGEPKIVIDTAKQRAYFYKGTHTVGTSPISSGKPGRSTPKGTYRIAEKDFVRYSGTFGVARDKKTHEIVMPDFNTKVDSMPKDCYYEPARMAYCLRFFNGYCFHQGEVTGKPISHGCVRITTEMAPLFYKEAKVGMPFIVK